MPFKLPDCFVSHPTISTKETCKACLSRLEAKKLAIENDKYLKNSQRSIELLKKESQNYTGKKAQKGNVSATSLMAHFKIARAKPRPPRPSTRPSRASSSTTTSYREDSDDEAFEEMIATGEHAKYLEDLRVEQEREEKRKKRKELEAKQSRKKDDLIDDEYPDYSAYFSKSRSASPA